MANTMGERLAKDGERLIKAISIAHPFIKLVGKTELVYRPELDSYVLPYDLRYVIREKGIIGFLKGKIATLERGQAGGIFDYRDVFSYKEHYDPVLERAVDELNKRDNYVFHDSSETDLRQLKLQFSRNG